MNVWQQSEYTEREFKAAFEKLSDLLGLFTLGLFRCDINETEAKSTRVNKSSWKLWISTLPMQPFEIDFSQ